MTDKDKIKILKDALIKIAEEHDEQEANWRFDGEDGHADYHAKWAKVARRALRQTWKTD